MYQHFPCHCESMLKPKIAINAYMYMYNTLYSKAHLHNDFNSRMAPTCIIDWFNTALVTPSFQSLDWVMYMYGAWQLKFCRLKLDFSVTKGDVDRYRLSHRPSWAHQLADPSGGTDDPIYSSEEYTCLPGGVRRNTLHLKQNGFSYKAINPLNFGKLH